MQTIYFLVGKPRFFGSCTTIWHGPILVGLAHILERLGPRSGPWVIHEHASIPRCKLCSLNAKGLTPLSASFMFRDLLTIPRVKMHKNSTLIQTCAVCKACLIKRFKYFIEHSWISWKWFPRIAFLLLVHVVIARSKCTSWLEKHGNSSQGPDTVIHCFLISVYLLLESYEMYSILRLELLLSTQTHGDRPMIMSHVTFEDRNQPLSQPVPPFEIHSKGRPLLGNLHQKAWSLSQPGNFHGIHGSPGRVRLEFRPDVWYSYLDLVKFYGKWRYRNLKYIDVMGQG